MIKNIIIAILALMNIVLISLWFLSYPIGNQAIVFRFPEIKLAKAERITSVQAQFESASIKSIRNIPPGWVFNVTFDASSNPKVVGSITVGAAALSGSKELPIFELGHYIKELNPTPVRAIFEIEEYSKNPAKPRKVTVDLTKSRSK